MSKRIFSILVLTLTLSTATVFAGGIGAQGGFVAGPNYSHGALTFKFDTAPWVFALKVENISSEYLGIGLTSDMWLANKTLAAPLAYYYGWGLAGWLGLRNDTYRDFFVGGRALLGLNAILIDEFLELYTQVAWQPGVKFHLADNSGADLIINSFPINIGFRLWF